MISALFAFSAFVVVEEPDPLYVSPCHNDESFTSLVTCVELLHMFAPTRAGRAEMKGILDVLLGSVEELRGDKRGAILRKLKFGEVDSHD